ncbi:cytokinin hydroxylase-like [Aristolochia californica]|uniref:cytokinin hydroxylase-like n=1 Tax=Aristolochia californica TaxID=171875 RepID=UPI0035D8C6B4
MGLVQFLHQVSLLTAVLLLLAAMVAVLQCWIRPVRANRKLKKNGFSGPPPFFPLGNINEMTNKRKKMKGGSGSEQSLKISHDIHSAVFPFFSHWRQRYGKVFIYWLGTEPFLYIGEPEFLKQVASGVLSKTWGKPTVFKSDREPLFGKGLVMVEGEDWARQRHIITPAFSPNNLKAMMSIMVESTNQMLDKWSSHVRANRAEINVERGLTDNAAEIIAKTSFGMSNPDGQKVSEKLQAMQRMLFKSNRMVGVPFNKYIHPLQTLESKKLGKEIDDLFLSIITSRKAKGIRDRGRPVGNDLLSLLMAENERDGRVGKKLTERELVDECKTFFFGGLETTALALSWTLLVLALHPDWQSRLREEIKEVTGGQSLNFTMLSKLEKMGWVLNEVLRLYPSSPNIQRQAREEIRVGEQIIPKGTNIWIDLVGLHHDPDLWEQDVNEFKPERFEKGSHGWCKHRMGYLPFGLGGRMCIGRNLSIMEYKIALASILTRFSFSVSQNYCHSPAVMLTTRPTHGVQLILESLQ